MKNIVKFMLITFIILFSCGCSNKLECEKQEENILEKVSISFKDNKPSLATYEIKYTYDSLDAYIDMKLLELQEEYAIYDNIKGLTYNIKENDNDLIVKINLDYTIYNNSRNEIPIIINDIENNKINLNNLGFKCK